MGRKTSSVLASVDIWGNERFFDTIQQKKANIRTFWTDGEHQGRLNFGQKMQRTAVIGFSFRTIRHLRNKGVYHRREKLIQNSSILNEVPD